MSEELLMKLLGGATVFAVYAYLFIAAKLKLSDERRSFVMQALDVGYGVVNEIARVTPNTLDDKFAKCLEIANEYLRNAGKRALSNAEAASAKLAATARHGDEAKMLERSGELIPPGAVGVLAALPAASRAGTSP